MLDYISTVDQIKFRFSKKATKFETIFKFLWPFQNVQTIPMKLLIFFSVNRNVHSLVFSNLTNFLFYKVDYRVATNLPGYISIGDQNPMKL
jgi:hypothetical protein